MTALQHLTIPQRNQWAGFICRFRKTSALARKSLMVRLSTPSELHNVHSVNSASQHVVDAGQALELTRGEQAHPPDGAWGAGMPFTDWWRGAAPVSVVAWDGKSVAADKQGTCAGLRFTTTKLRRLEGGAVLAWTGEQGPGEAVAAWYEEGADRAKWPECQKDKETWARLIVDLRRPRAGLRAASVPCAGRGLIHGLGIGTRLRDGGDGARG